MTKTETDKRGQDQQSGSATLPRGGFSFETIEANRWVVTLRFAEAADAEAFLIKFWSEKSQMTQRCFGLVPKSSKSFQIPILVIGPMGLLPEQKFPFSIGALRAQSYHLGLCNG